MYKVYPLPTHHMASSKYSFISKSTPWKAWFTLSKQVHVLHRVHWLTSVFKLTELAHAIKHITTVELKEAYKEIK